jgi:hypothetical protein
MSNEPKDKKLVFFTQLSTNKINLSYKIKLYR